ncbi:MAG TPA: hypothetical protein VKV17_20790 [Bryobacteraceae bacterium]|nr:hypothetical protein [Bryobacteraceae bacterium]
MMDLLNALEQSHFSKWLLESNSVFAYPTFLFLHTVGMAMVAGVSAAIDLRVVGVAPAIPIRPLERLYPVMWAGFGINLATGTALVIADATTKLTNPDFGIKMAFVFGGIALLAIMRKRIFRYPALDQAPLPARARALAWLSLACWTGAITCGRLLAYVGPVSGPRGLRVH